MVRTKIKIHKVNYKTKKLKEIGLWIEDDFVWNRPDEEAKHAGDALRNDQIADNFSEQCSRNEIHYFGSCAGIPDKLRISMEFYMSSRKPYFPTPL